MWNYKDSTEAKLTPAFRERFILDIRGVSAVKVDGLKVLAHEKGVKSLETEVLMYPSKENGGMTIVKATLVGYDYNPVKDAVEEVKFSAIGDASPANCSKNIAVHSIRMAETRAIGRALKNYVNIGMVSSEELYEATENKPNTVPATGDQKKILMYLLKRAGLNVDDLKHMYFETFKKIDISDMSENEALILMKELKQLPTNENVEKNESMEKIISAIEKKELD